MLKRSILTVCIIGFASAANAGSLDWADREQAGVVSKLGSAFANANLCNFEVDTDGTAQIIKSKIAPAGKLTPEMASALMFSVVGIGAMQAELLGTARMNKKQLAKHCAGIIDSFGPNGSSLAGVLKP